MLVQTQRIIVIWVGEFKLDLKFLRTSNMATNVFIPTTDRFGGYSNQHDIPLTPSVHKNILVVSITLIPLEILIIFGRDGEEDRRCVACKRNNSHFLPDIPISPEAEILCRQ